MMKYVGFLCCMLLLTACPDNTKEEIKSETVEPEVETEIRSWRSVASKDGSQPVERHEAAFVKVDKKFYLLGGRSIRAVSIYDTETESWSLGAKPPIELHHFQPVVYKNKIYIIAALTGGWPDETPTEHIYSYDPSMDEWSKGDEIPKERRRGATGNILHEGKIYIACGIKNGHIGDHKNWMDRYDPETGAWEILADAPRPRDHFQAVLANGKIYAPAGRNTGIDPDDGFAGTISEVDVYDIKNNSWETLPNNIPTERAGNAATFYDGAIVVVGGESPRQEKAHAEVEALDLQSYEWQTLPALLEGRHGTGLVQHDNALFIASGCGNRGGSPELFSMEKLD